MRGQILGPHLGCAKWYINCTLIATKYQKIGTAFRARFGAGMRSRFLGIKLGLNCETESHEILMLVANVFLSKKIKGCDSNGAPLLKNGPQIHL